MADLFTRLARRTLAPTLRLSVRLPSRYEPQRRAGIGTEAQLQDESASFQRSPMGSGAKRVDFDLGRTEERLPPSPSVTVGGDTTNWPAPAVAAHSERDTRPRDRSQPLEASIFDDHLAGHPQRHSPSSGQPRSRKSRPPSATDRERIETSSTAADEPRVEAEKRAPVSASNVTSDRDQRPPREDEAAAFKERLSPLLPRQPVPVAMAPSTSEIGAGDRGGRRESPSAPPTVEVTIGSIEVRAVQPAISQAPSRPGPTLTLDDYLKRPDRGGP